MEGGATFVTNTNPLGVTQLARGASRVITRVSPPARRPRNAACRPHGSRSILNTQPCRGISEARVSGYTICPHPHNGHSRQSSLFDEPNHAARRTFYCQTLAAQSVFSPGGPLPCSIKLVFFSVVVAAGSWLTLSSFSLG